MRIEELGRSVVFLTRENQELREQNEIFRQMVVSPSSLFLFGVLSASRAIGFGTMGHESGRTFNVVTEAELPL